MRKWSLIIFDTNKKKYHDLKVRQGDKNLFFLVEMSYPTSPYLLYDNRTTVNREPFDSTALMPRYGAFSDSVSYACSAQTVNASNPALVSLGSDRGIGYNNGILDYQFGSHMNVPFCGVSLAAERAAGFGVMVPADCEQCPCQTPGCANFGSAPNIQNCDYGYARNHGSVFGPNGGNRNGNLKWGG